MAERNIQLTIGAANRTATALRGASQAVGTFADGTIGHFRRLSASVLNLRSMLVGGIFGATINKLTQDGDQVDKLSQRLAVTTEEFQVLRHAMELGGGSAGQLETAFRSLTRRIFMAESGAGEAMRSFDALGVTMADLRGKTPMKQFTAVFQALGRIDDASRRSAVAQEMFSRAGLTLLPVLNSTGGSLDALATKMRRNGQLLSQEQIAKSAKFRDSLTDLNRAIQASLFDVLEEQIGGLSKAIDDLVDSGKLKTWGRDAAAAVHAVYSALKDLADFISRNRETLKTLGLSYVAYRVLTSATAAVVALKAELALATGAATGLGVATATIGTGVATAGIAYLISQVIQIGIEARKAAAELRRLESDGTIAAGRLAEHARKGVVGQFFGNLGEVLRHGPGGDPNALRIRTTAPGRSQIAAARAKFGERAPADAAPSPPEAPADDPADLRDAASAAEATARLAAAEREFAQAQLQEDREGFAQQREAQAQALVEVRDKELQTLREGVETLEDLATKAKRAADAAWNNLLNPQTKAEKDAADAAEKQAAKLERSLARARARADRGLRVNRRSRDLIAADDLRRQAAAAEGAAGKAREDVRHQEVVLVAQAQASLAQAAADAADAMPRVVTETALLADEMATLRTLIATLTGPALPALPTMPSLPGLPSMPDPTAPAGSNTIAADIAAIRHNTAQLLAQGIL